MKEHDVLLTRQHSKKLTYFYDVGYFYNIANTEGPVWCYQFNTIVNSVKVTGTKYVKVNANLCQKRVYYVIRSIRLCASWDTCVVGSIKKLNKKVLTKNFL